MKDQRSTFQFIGTLQICTPMFDVGTILETYGLFGTIDINRLKRSTTFFRRLRWDYGNRIGELLHDSRLRCEPLPNRMCYLVVLDETLNQSIIRWPRATVSERSSVVRSMFSLCRYTVDYCSTVDQSIMADHCCLPLFSSRSSLLLHWNPSSSSRSSLQLWLLHGSVGRLL